jgi:hypothetical protein
MTNHTHAWKRYKVHRSLAKGGKVTSDGCNAQYCIPDEPHNDYLFTPAWVAFLVKTLADEGEYLALTSRRTPAARPNGSDSAKAEAGPGASNTSIL